MARRKLTDESPEHWDMYGLDRDYKQNIVLRYIIYTKGVQKHMWVFLECGTFVNKILRKVISHCVHKERKWRILQVEYHLYFFCWNATITQKTNAEQLNSDFSICNRSLERQTFVIKISLVINKGKLISTIARVLENYTIGLRRRGWIISIKGLKLQYWKSVLLKLIQRVIFIIPKGKESFG